MRKVLVVGVLLLSPVMLSACLSIAGGQIPALVSNNGQPYDMGDPAAIEFPPPNIANQIYTTNVWSGFSRVYGVPSWTEYLNGARYVNGSFMDALPAANVPSWDTGNIWAPSVSYVGGRYLMVFSGSRSGGANCIGEATSQNPNTVFSGLGTEWCAENLPSGCALSSTLGFLDPTIVIGTDSSINLIWSEQPASDGDSWIVSKQLNAAGTGWANNSCPAALLDYGAASLQVYGSLDGNAPMGTYPEVENPSAVVDASGGYDMTASVGTWNDNDYYTVQVHCGTITVASSCGGPGYMESEGGMTFGQSASTLYGIFAFPAPTRSDYEVKISQS